MGNSKTKKCLISKNIIIQRKFDNKNKIVQLFYSFNNFTSLDLNHSFFVICVIYIMGTVSVRYICTTSSSNFPIVFFKKWTNSKIFQGVHLVLISRSYRQTSALHYEIET